MNAVATHSIAQGVNTCTGCAACAAACPTKAIAMYRMQKDFSSRRSMLMSAQIAVSAEKHALLTRKIYKRIHIGKEQKEENPSAFSRRGTSMKPFAAKAPPAGSSLPLQKVSLRRMALSQALPLTTLSSGISLLKSPPTYNASVVPSMFRAKFPRISTTKSAICSNGAVSFFFLAPRVRSRAYRAFSENPMPICSAVTLPATASPRPSCLRVMFRTTRQGGSIWQQSPSVTKPPAGRVSVFEGICIMV